MNPKKSNRTEDLILRHVDSDLTPSEERELASLLEDSADARALFASHMRLQGGLLDLGLANAIGTSLTSNQELESPIQEASRVSPGSSDTERSNRHSYRWFVGTVVTAVSILITFLVLNRQEEGHEAPETLPAVVGHFSRLVDVAWSDPQDSKLGDAIYAGTVHLEKGLAEIEFTNGAVLIVEGPSRIEIDSAEKAFLHFGKIRSNVPPQALGFTIESAEMKIVDLGTEFGLEVDEDGTSELHVFDGEVEVYETRTTAASKQLLRAGQAVQIERLGIRRELPADRGAFVDANILQQRALDYVEDLNDQINALAARQRVLSNNIKSRETLIRQSAQLQELKRKADKAQDDFKKAMEVNDSLRKVQIEKSKLQSNLDQMVRDKLAKRSKSAMLLSRLDENEQELRAAKRQLDTQDLKSVKKRQLTKQIRRLQKDRTNFRKQVRQLRSELRKSDPEVQNAHRSIHRIRKKMESLLASTGLSKLRENSMKKRTKFLSKRSHMIKNDAKLQTTRQELRKISAQIRDARKRIHKARKWDTILVANPWTNAET